MYLANWLLPGFKRLSAVLSPKETVRVRAFKETITSDHQSARMPMIVELLKGFAPSNMRSAIVKFGQDHPNIIAKYTGDFDAYVPFIINDVEVCRHCDTPEEQSPIEN